MYVNEQGIQFSDDKKTLLSFPYDLVGVYIIPKGLEHITKEAFSGTHLTAISVPEGVMSIGQGAFDFNEMLEHLFLPSSIVQLDDIAGVEGHYNPKWVVYVPKGHAERIRALDPTLKHLTFIELTEEEMIERPKALKEQFRIEWEAKSQAGEDLKTDWSKRVDKMKEARAKGAHTLVVDIEVYLGCSCWGGRNSCDAMKEIEVSDAVMDTILSLMEQKKPANKNDFRLSSVEIQQAIDNGHTELEELQAELIDRCSYVEELYWCTEDYNSDQDESLEPAFYKDVKSGLYVPEPDDEDYEGKLDFDACHDNYLAWVQSHTDDLWFMAERLGVELNTGDGDYAYFIKDIK